MMSLRSDRAVSHNPVLLPKSPFQLNRTGGGYRSNETRPNLCSALRTTAHSLVLPPASPRCRESDDPRRRSGSLAGGAVLERRGRRVAPRRLPRFFRRSGRRGDRHARPREPGPDRPPLHPYHERSPDIRFRRSRSGRPLPRREPPGLVRPRRVRGDQRLRPRRRSLPPGALTPDSHSRRRAHRSARSRSGFRPAIRLREQ